MKFGVDLKKQSPAEIWRHVFFVNLFPRVPAHEISLVFIYLLVGTGLVKKQITMARTAKMDKLNKIIVCCHFLRLSRHWWERSYLCSGGLKQ